MTILADYGNRYQSKLFNPGLPARQGLCRCPAWPHRIRAASIKVLFE